MFKIYLNVNSNNEDRERATAFISSLIFSINRAKNNIEKNRLERLIPIINNEFEDGLILINCPFSSKVKLTRYLENIHNTALGITHTKYDPASDIETKTETDEIVYKNELFKETEAAEDTTSIADDLNSFEDTINAIVPEKIVTSLEEAFCEADKVEADKDETINFKNKQAETSSINQHRVNTQEKQSKTDFELIRLVNNSYKMTVINDGHTSKVKSINEDSWLEFRFKTHFSRARVTWIADDKSQFNCLTQNDRVIEISLEALSDSFRQGICSVIQSSSVIDEAIKAVSDKASSKEQVVQ